MENGVSIFIAVGIGVLLITQAVVFVGLYLLARRVVSVVERAGELQTRAEYLLNNTEPVVKLAHHLMADLKEASGYFVQGAEQIHAITEMARDEVAEVKSLLGDATALTRREIERARGHVQKVQETIAEATDEFEKTTALVQRSILEPAREFSYVMYGVRRAVEVLVTRNRLPVNRAYQDEEMFI